MNKVSDDLIDSGIIKAALGEIKDIDSLKKIKEDYFSIPQNKELDKRGRRMYSAGFNRYIYFRENQGDLPVSNEGIVYKDNLHKLVCRPRSLFCPCGSIW